MSTQDNNSLEALIRKAGVRLGLIVKDDSPDTTTAANANVYIDANSKIQASAMTASKPVYVDSNSVPQSAALPFSLPIVANGTSTTQTFLNLTGSSSESGSNDMGLQLVKGSDYTTFTKSGAIKVTITDSAGNLVNGDHYIQIGTLS